MIQISINQNQPKPQKETKDDEMLIFEDVSTNNQQQQQEIPSQRQNLDHLKDYVPQNMFNEIVSHQDVDFDTLMLNEAIRLSQIQENEIPTSGTFIDTSGDILCF
jgi:hypothetical protein